MLIVDLFVAGERADGILRRLGGAVDSVADGLGNALGLVLSLVGATAEVVAGLLSGGLLRPGRR